MESLPPTSDIKMIDIWLILCQMDPFAEIIQMSRRSQVPRIANIDETNENIVWIW